MGAASCRSVLLLRAGERTCALSLFDVLEIMRPLPIDEVARAPGFLRGLSMIRGVPTPVVSLASLWARPDGSSTRFVLVRAGQERRVALAVDEVLGVLELDPATLHALPPLAQNAADTLEAIGALDGQLLFVLNSGRIVPDEVWQEVAPRKP